MPENQTLVKFVELYNSGADFTTIMRELNRSQTSVHDYHRRLGLPVRRRLTKREQEAEVRMQNALNLFRAGHTIREVAGILNITNRQAERYKSKLGLATGKPGEKTPDEIMVRAAAMVEDCCPPAEISETLGVGKRWVYKKFPEYRYKNTPGALPNYGRYKYLLEMLPEKLERVSIK